MSTSSISKKREQSLNFTLCNLCHDLLRFIDRKIIKKYISPNIAQLSKEKRNIESKEENKNKVWTYFFKDEKITQEEKIKDVFKDDQFLGYLQNLTNSLIIVVNYLDQNLKNVKKLEQDVKNKEEKMNSLNELKILLNNYFDKNGGNNENNANTEQKGNYNILEDQNLMNIMSKIQYLNSEQFSSDDEKKITQNLISIAPFNNNNNNNDNKINNINLNEKNNFCNINNNNNANNTKSNKNNKEKNSQKDNINNINLIFPRKNNDKDNKISKIKDKNLFNNFQEPIKQGNSNTKLSPKKLNSKEKSEIDILIDNYNSDLFNKPKEDEKQKDKKFLNKKIERENEKEKHKEKGKQNESKKSTEIEKDKINTIIINKKDLTSDKKKKNKKKKTKNSDESSKKSEKEEKTDLNSKQIPLKEEILNLPVLKPILDKNKEIIEFEIESQDKNNKSKISGKKNGGQILNNEVISILLENDKDKKEITKNKSLEDLFDSELKKEFCNLNPVNNRAKLKKEILSSIKTKDIKNYNPRINGPYLTGSYKTISELSSINYSSPIDIMYTYKDMLLNETIIDFTVNNIIKNTLNLNIIKKLEYPEDENKITKLSVKCTSKQNISIIIFFNIFFVDIGFNYNEKIVNDIIFNGEKMNFGKKEEEKKYITIILYLRTWRKKYKLFFIIPEILDEFVKKYFEPNKSMGVIILNVFYDLYHSVIDFNSKKNQGILPKHKSLYEKLIQQCFEPDKNKEMIQKAVIDMNKLINNRNFRKLFITDDEEE